MSEAHPRAADVAHSYHIKNQAACYHIAKFGIKVACDPEKLFASLIESAATCKFRTWLADPVNRKRAEYRLELYRQMAELRKLKSESLALADELETKIATLNAQARQ